jgi:murein DD-endopeptidase MepM/ murein hydrolase activator NlpD
MSGHRRTSAAQFAAFLARALGLGAIVAAAGCSADVTRFSLFGSDFLGNSGAPPAASPVAYAPPSHGPSRAPSGPTWGSGVRETTLPPLPSQDYRVVGRDYRSASPPQFPPRSEPMARPSDRPLWTDGDPPPWTDRDPLPWADPATGHKPGPALGQSSAWQGRHTMQSGESLYAIARRHKVSVDDLKRVNGITDSSKVWAGKVLTVPDGSGATANSAPTPVGPPRIVQVTPRIVGTVPAEPRPAPEAPQKMAKHDAAASDAGPAVAGGKFRWPARGRIISGFGSQPDGSKNEGINLAVPLGTEIHAAEAGRVHYVGDGLKGYGNLILIRHANDWVTAYAHADQILVKANDEVRRGQVIGKAGKTGPVAQPQLRFELRKGSVPVDPVPHLAN